MYIYYCADCSTNCRTRYTAVCIPVGVPVNVTTRSVESAGSGSAILI